MKKKFLIGLLLCFCTIFCAIGLVACNSDNTESGDNRDKQIVSIYNTYVAYAEGNGTTPLSYEEWLENIKGKDGTNGLNGKDGENGKDGVDGQDGKDGRDGVDGENGKDGIGIADMKIEDGKLYVKYTNSQNYLEIGEIQSKSGLEFIQKLYSKELIDFQKTITGDFFNYSVEILDKDKTLENISNYQFADSSVLDKIVRGLFVKATLDELELYYNYGLEFSEPLTNDIDISVDFGGYEDSWILEIVPFDNNIVFEYSVVIKDVKDGVDGENGKDGQDGVGIADMKIEDGKLFVKYTNSENYIELGQVLGKDGKDGENGQDGVDGENGKDGIGIADMKIEDGKLFVKYTNSENYIELGQVLGQDGKDGQDGSDGNDGADGLTPHIKDGYWWIGETNTNVKAQGTDGKDGEKGQDGVTPTISISQDGYWVINGHKTDTKAVGVDGQNGQAGKDGIDGKDGDDGENGKDGQDGLTPHIKDGYWWIGETNTNVKAQGTDGKDGQDGSDAKEVKSAEIDKDGNLIITYKDDTSENIGKIKDNSKCEHEYVDYMVTKLGDNVYKKEYYCIKCFETKSELVFDTSSKDKSIIVNGEELNPKNESVYYFNSTEELTKYVGFPIALNGLELKDCEGYWNVELSINSFDIYIDESMSILGIMYACSEIYHPLGSGNYTIGEMLTYTIENGLKHYVLTELGRKVADAQLRIPTKCIIVTKVLDDTSENTTAENTVAIINGVEINPITNSKYYFNSKSKEMIKQNGFSIDLNAMGLKKCEGYWNVELSVKSFDVSIDNTMEILGIMYYDELGNRYAPLGSGNYTIGEMLTYTIENGLKHYVLTELGRKVADAQLRIPTKCIIVTKVLDGSDELIEYNIFENK